MLNILYEDRDVIVVVKPAGVEAQSARRFAPDMVSEIRKHLVINKICTKGKEPYVELSTGWTSRCRGSWSMGSRKRPRLL